MIHQTQRLHHLDCEHQKTAVIFKTHFLNDAIKEKIASIKKQLPPRHELYIVLNCGDGDFQLSENSSIFGVKIFQCNRNSIKSLKYPNKCRFLDSEKHWSVGGNADLITLAFTKSHPQYDYYWGIEYDVHYEGSWGTFFKHFEKSDSDLIGTTIVTINLKKQIYGGRAVLNEKGEKPDNKDYVWGFYPIYRLSRKMIATLDKGYIAGWQGHYESTFGTMANINNLKIEDIGGSGPFTAKENINSFYFNNVRSPSHRPGTFVYRPEFSKIIKKENVLWHPVKPSGNYHIHNPYCTSTKSSYLRMIIKASKGFCILMIIRLWFFTKWKPINNK